MTKKNLQPVAIGGIGGSGTRLIAQWMSDLGYYLGGDLNESLDNLWFTLLFKRRSVLDDNSQDFCRLAQLFVERMVNPGRLDDPKIGDCLMRLANESRYPEYTQGWYVERAHTFMAGMGAGPGCFWGWKEPNTHLVLGRLRESIPDLRYIHVMRNGLDMAYSANQTQLKLWGPALLGDEVMANPRDALKFWRRVHERVLALGQEMSGHFLLLDYDRLCIDPLKELQRLLDFLGHAVEAVDREYLVSQVRPPASMGRFKQHGLDAFNPDDVAFVERMGYSTSLN